MFRRLVSIILVFAASFAHAAEQKPSKNSGSPVCQQSLDRVHQYDSWEINESEDPVTYRLRVLELMNKYLKDRQSRRAYNLGTLYLQKFPQLDLALYKSLLAAAYASHFLGEAQGFALKIHEADPTYLNAIGILAKLAIKRKDFKTALIYAKKQLKIRPESLHALGFAADACIGLEDFEGALKYAKEQHRLAPESDFGRTYMASAYIGLNQLPEARKLLQQILDKSPNNPVASGVLMRVDLDLRNFSKVVQTAQTRIDHDKSDILAWYMKGLALIELRKFLEATQAVNTLRRLETDSSRGDLLNIRLLRAQGRIAEAQIACTDSLKKSPYSKHLIELCNDLQLNTKN